MRDKNRLDGFYEQLCRLHKEYCPDWRFGQLMYNFMASYGDPFYLDEDRMIEKMTEYLTKGQETNE